MVFCISIVLNAQNTTNSIYIIMTSKTNAEDGIGRFVHKKDSMDKTSSINYFVTDRSKNIHLIFDHLNYDIAKLTKVRKVRANDQQETLTKSASFLKTITPIDLDILLPKWTREQALAFRDSMQGKKIYIIDRSEIKNNQMELVEVRCIKPTW